MILIVPARLAPSSVEQLRHMPDDNTLAVNGGDALGVCAFCDMIAGALPATIVAQDALTVAFLDLRQFHPGHVLVVPRTHVRDIRGADDQTAAAILVMVTRVARAVDATFPADGLSIWHSAGPGANQEVPHLHFHIHPRRSGDDLLRVYPTPPECPSRSTLETWGARLMTSLAERSCRYAP